MDKKQTIQLFRNLNVITSRFDDKNNDYGSIRQHAIGVANAQLEHVKDGEVYIVRFQEGEGEPVKSLIAIPHKPEEGTATVTIFDLDHDAYTLHESILLGFINNLKEAVGTDTNVLTFSGEILSGQTTVFNALVALEEAVKANKTSSAEALDGLKKELLGVPSDASQDDKDNFANDTLWELDQAIKQEIDNRVKAVAAAKTEVVKTDGKAHVTIESSVTSGEGEDGHVVYTINEDDIASANLLGTTSDTITDNTAFGFIAREAANRDSAITAAVADAKAYASSYTDAEIAKLDSAIAANDGQFVTAFEINGGKVTSSAMSSLSSTNKTIAINNFDIDVNIDGTTIVENDGVLSVASAALTQYVGSDAIAVGNADDDNNKAISLTISSDDTFLSVKSEGNKGLIAKVGLKKLTDGEVADLAETNVKDAYRLVDKNGSAVTGADIIKIYKDSSVKDVHIGKSDVFETLWDETAKENVISDTQKENPQKLYITYILEDGKEKTLSVDFSSFIAEAEMGDGMKVVDGVVTLDIDGDAEYIGFTDADADGHRKLTVTGIDTAIAAAASASKTVVVEEADAVHVKVSAVTHNGEGEDGHMEYVIQTSDIASAALLGAIGDNEDAQTAFGFIAKEAAERDSAITAAVAALSAETVSGEGKFISSVAQGNGVVTAVATEFATAVTEDGKVAPTSEAVYSAITSAKIELIGEFANAPQSDSDGFQTLGEATNWAFEAENAINCIHKALGIPSGETCLPDKWNDGTNYSTATTIVGALKDLDDAVKANASATDIVKTVVVNGVTGTTENNTATVTINGSNIALDGYNIANSASGIDATDTVNAALGKLEYKVDLAAADSLNEVEEYKEGENGRGAIDVTNKDRKKQTLKVKVDDSTIKINGDDKLYVDVIDGGTF